MTIVEQARHIRDTLNGLSFGGSYEQILDIPYKLIDDWVPGRTYKSGQLVLKDGVKYLVLQDNITAMAHQPPDLPDGAMLAVYKPFRDVTGVYEWLYGEYCPKNCKRTWGGKLYIVKQTEAGANIFPPPMLPAIWGEIL